jgi:prepilin-type N-terminal cleavage/methylation domain-containing protein
VKVGLSKRGFNLIELVVIIAIVAVLFALLVPMTRNARPRAKRIACINNQRQIGLRFRIFAADHENNFPMTISTNMGGSKEFVNRLETFRHFEATSKDRSATWTLICPTDIRNSAETPTQLSNTNLSYFVTLNAVATNTSMVLIGDRNITTNKQAFVNGIYTLSTNAELEWTDSMHVRCGNIGYVDGSALHVTSPKLRGYLEASETIHRLGVP